MIDIIKLLFVLYCGAVVFAGLHGTICYGGVGPFRLIYLLWHGKVRP